MLMRKLGLSLLPTILFGGIWCAVDAATIVGDIPFVGKRSFHVRGGSLSLERSQKGDSPLVPNVLTEESQDNDNTTSTTSYDFSLLQPGEDMEKSVHFQRYVRMQKGNIDKAKKAFENTLEWREANEVDSKLTRPHPDYDICKRIQIHHFPGRDPSNHIVFIQRPGSLDFDLGHYNNVTKEDLLNHYVWVLEYCWNILEPQPDQIMTNVLDMKGVKFSRVQQYLGFIRKFLGVMSQHYPQRSYKTLIINSPSWTSAAYKLVAPFLRESTRKKISIHSSGSKQDKVLLEVLGAEACPANLLSTGKLGRDNGGTNERNGDTSERDGVYDNDMEVAMRDFCLARLKEAGVAMKEIKELSW